jgi:hypothetical protein
MFAWFRAYVLHKSKFNYIFAVPFSGNRKTNVPDCIAGIAQLVERDLAKVEVAGSSPVSRSYFLPPPGDGGWFFYYTLFQGL